MKLNSFFIRTFAVFVSMLFIGCSSEPITPEVTVSEGTVNYFSESMDFPSNDGSKILNFTSNVKWTLTHIAADPRLTHAIMCKFS